MLFYGWATVCDAGPTINQYRLVLTGIVLVIEIALSEHILKSNSFVKNGTVHDNEGVWSLISYDSREYFIRPLCLIYLF